MKVELEDVVGILMDAKENTITESEWDNIDEIIRRVRDLPTGALIVRETADLPMTYEDQVEEAVSGRR